MFENLLLPRATASAVVTLNGPENLDVLTPPTAGGAGDVGRTSR